MKSLVSNPPCRVAAAYFGRWQYEKKGMKNQLLYVELKSGYSDNGPAWIGRGSQSKSGRTIYFNDKALQPTGGQGIQGNYRDIEAGDEYWISGVKKDQSDRHWAGSGVIMVDESAVDEYLAFIGAQRLDERKYKITRLKEGDVRVRVKQLENSNR